jgi:hypothetical protein
MALKSYIRGFGAYPVDTREMMAATNTFLASASQYALDEDSITLTLANTNIRWTYFGSQCFLTAMYSDTPAGPVSDFCWDDDDGSYGENLAFVDSGLQHNGVNYYTAEYGEEQIEYLYWNGSTWYIYSELNDDFQPNYANDSSTNDISTAVGSDWTDSGLNGEILGNGLTVGSCP